MKPDVVIVIAPGMDLEDMLAKVSNAAFDLIEKHVLQQPISARVLDGHGKQFIEGEWIWDTDGPLELAGRGFTALPEADGLFLLMEDSQGKTVTVKFQVEGQREN